MAQRAITTTLEPSDLSGAFPRKIASDAEPSPKGCVMRLGNSESQHHNWHLQRLCEDPAVAVIYELVKREIKDCSQLQLLDRGHCSIK
eukprot:s1873_g3.t1